MTIPMRLSIAFDGSMPFSVTLPAVATAQACGLDGVWSAEHLGLHDSVTASAAYLTRTAGLEIGLVGLNASSRHPGLLAMELAALAELGRGRVRAQVGTGDAGLARRIGARTAHPLAEVEAMVSAIRALLLGEEVTLAGPSFRLDRFALRRFRHEATVPLDVMAIRPRMLELAARVGDGVGLSTGASLSYLTDTVKTVEEHLVHFGRDRDAFRITALALASIDDDLEVARHRAAMMLTYAPPGFVADLCAGVDGIPDPEKVSATLQQKGASSAAALFPAETVDALSVVATPRSLAGILAAYQSTGIDELALVMTGPSASVSSAVTALGAAKPHLR